MQNMLNVNNKIRGIMKMTCYFSFNKLFHITHIYIYFTTQNNCNYKNGSKVYTPLNITTVSLPGWSTTYSVNNELLFRTALNKCFKKNGPLFMVHLF